MEEVLNSLVQVLVNPRVTDPVEILMFLNAHISFFSLATDWFESAEKVVLGDGCVINEGRGFSLSEGICGYNVDELQYSDGGFMEVSTTFEVIRLNAMVISCICYLIFLLRITFSTRRTWINIFAALAAVLAVVDIVIYINLVNKINILQSGAFHNYGPGFILHCIVVVLSFSILGIEFYSNFDDI
jgi:hypothetical protein